MTVKFSKSLYNWDIKYIPITCLFFLLIVNTTLFSQKKENILARVGGKLITAEEYKKRFELMPHVGSADWNIDTTKFEFLCSLIAEKLWGMEAQKRGLDTLESARYSSLELEKMFARDALYKEVIENKIEIPQHDLKKGMSRYGIKLKINILASRDSSEIFNLYSLLQKGAGFDALLKSRPEFDDQDSAGMEITYGQMDEMIEDTLFNLKTGAFSVPVRNKAGWFIFRLKDKTIPGSSDQDKTLKSVKKTIKDKIAERLYNEYYNNFFTGKRVEANGVLFWAIADKVIDIFNEKRKNPDYDRAEYISLSAEDILKIENKLGPDTLKREVIKLDKKGATVKEFLRSLMYNGFTSNKFDPKIIAVKVNDRLKGFIESELLADEALSKGLQNLPRVKDDLDMWKQNYIGQLLKAKIRDSVNITEQELYQYYLDKQKAPKGGVTKVNIQEILNDSLDVIDKVLTELKEGMDFGTLAGIHTKRRWTKEKGGELGFLPVDSLGEIGRTAEKMNIGEIVGPLKLPEGYSVIKLLAKKTEEDTVSRGYSEVKEEIKKEYYNKKYQDVLLKSTAELASKYNVVINIQALKQLDVINLNMYTYRYMGFGGRINAVPLVAPLFEWYPQMKYKKMELQ